MSCINCHKKKHFCLKECALNKFNIRRKEIVQRLNERDRLLAGISLIIEPVNSVKDMMTMKEERLIKLKFTIKKTQAIINLKQEESIKLDSVIKSLPTKAAANFESQSDYLRKFVEKKKEKSEILRKVQQELAISRLSYCEQLFRIFPLRVVNLENVMRESKDLKDWVIVNDDEPQKQIMIRNSSINKKTLVKLVTQLCDGVITPDLHSPFTVVTNTFQLVHLLNIIFNFRPPALLTSHYDTCVCKQWTKESINSIWSSLCDAVIYLCITLGVPSNDLKYSNPLQNLMTLTSFVSKNLQNVQCIESRPTYNLSEVQGIHAPYFPIL